MKIKEIRIFNAVNKNIQLENGQNGQKIANENKRNWMENKKTMKNGNALRNHSRQCRPW